MSETMIGKACWYRLFAEDGWGDWKGGRLVSWSTAHEECETGPGPFPVGVVVDEATCGVVVH